MANRVIAPASVQALWNLNLVVSRACHVCADMVPMEYGILASIREREWGLSQRLLRKHAGEEALSRHYEEQLLAKELIARMRDRNDRRAIAYAITSRGKKLVDQVDRTIALSVAGRYSRIGEADFEKLVSLMHALSSQCNPDLVSSLVFPSEAIRGLARFHRLAVYEISRVSLSLSQLAVLCASEAEGRSVDVRGTAARLDIGQEAFGFLLEGLEEKGLVDRDDAVGAFVASPAGIERSRILRGRIGASLDASMSDLGMQAKASFYELENYITYLFV